MIITFISRASPHLKVWLAKWVYVNFTDDVYKENAKVFVWVCAGVCVTVSNYCDKYANDNNKLFKIP